MQMGKDYMNKVFKIFSDISSRLGLNQCFSTRVTLSPMKRLTMSRDLWFHSWQGGCSGRLERKELLEASEWRSGML